MFLQKFFRFRDTMIENLVKTASTVRDTEFRALFFCHFKKLRCKSLFIINVTFKSNFEKILKHPRRNFFTTIFDLSKNDILCDLITMHKYRVFLTVVEKIILICQCHTGEVGKSQLRRQGSKAKDQHCHGFCPIDNPSKASKTILYLSKTEGAIFLTRII
jgi:hypothetical protein